MTTSDIPTIITSGLHWHTCTRTGDGELFDNALHWHSRYVSPPTEGEYFDSATFSRKEWAKSYARIQHGRTEERGRMARTDIHACASQCAIYPGN